PGTVSYDAATQTAQYVPASALATGTSYQATIKGGTNGGQDARGGGLASDVSWSFTTATGTVVAPAVPAGAAAAGGRQGAPADGAANVRAATGVTATFSRAMDGTTVTGETVGVTDAQNGSVPGTVSYDGATRTAQWRASSALTAGQRYQVRVTRGVRDAG